VPRHLAGFAIAEAFAVIERETQEQNRLPAPD
jgi:hypothetical protein